TFFLLLNVIFFWHFFLQGRIPLDSNPLYRNYPWRAAAQSELLHEVGEARNYHDIDETLSIYPIRNEIRRQLLDGHFPVWTDLVFCGSPLFGSQVSALGILSPLHYLLPSNAGY